MGLKDFVVGADADGGQVLAEVVATGHGHGGADNVVDGARGEVVAEEVAEGLDGAAEGAVAAADQDEDDLPQPSLGDGEVEEDAVVRRGREGVVQDTVGRVGDLVDELATDVMLVGECGDGGGAGEGEDGEVTALLRVQVMGGASVERGWGAVVDVGS